MAQVLVKLQKKGQLVLSRPMRDEVGVAEFTMERPAARKQRQQVLLELAAAVNALRKDAQAKGLEKMSIREINRAVAAARRESSKKRADHLAK